MNLTSQEKITMLYATLGYSDKEIGQKMKIHYATVRTYLSRALLKLAAKNRAHAAVRYIFIMTKEVYLKQINELNEAL